MLNEAESTLFLLALNNQIGHIEHFKWWVFWLWKLAELCVDSAHTDLMWACSQNGYDFFLWIKQLYWILRIYGRLNSSNFEHPLTIFSDLSIKNKASLQTESPKGSCLSAGSCDWLRSAIFPEGYTSYTHLKEPSPFSGGGNEPDLRCSWCRSLRTARQRVWE